jgi:hypothetical protein
MAEPQSPVSSAKPSDAELEPAASFYARLALDFGVDLDLDAVIREARQANPGPDLSS